MGPDPSIHSIAFIILPEREIGRCLANADQFRAGADYDGRQRVLILTVQG